MGKKEHPLRPNLEEITAASEFRRWYWLKEELVRYCRRVGISYRGGKAEIADRIAHYLSTGNVPSIIHPKKTSTFDWAREVLTLDTIITDSYTNGPNVRRLMKVHLGDHFRFTIGFMKWMKDNVGKTLGDAVEEWQRQHEQKQRGDVRTKIPVDNQYNRYLRDFFADNPNQDMATARRCWKLKRALPGPQRYEPSDLSLNDS